MAQKKYWKDSYEYKRIIEILDDYWLTEEDEKFVSVKMYFEKEDGQKQMKHIYWRNPNMQRGLTVEPGRDLGLRTVKQISDMYNLPFKEYVIMKYGLDGEEHDEPDYEYYTDNPKYDFAQDLIRDKEFPAFNYSHIYTDERHREIIINHMRLTCANLSDKVIDVFNELFDEWCERVNDAEAYKKMEQKGDGTSDV